MNLRKEGQTRPSQNVISGEDKTGMKIGTGWEREKRSHFDGIVDIDVTAVEIGVNMAAFLQKAIN